MIFKKIIALGEIVTEEEIKLEQNEDIEIFEKTISLSTKYFRDVYSFLNAIFIHKSCS